MIELLTAEEMAALDRHTIQQIGVPSLVLMENAADGCARALEERFAGGLDDGVVIVAGPGNNGGDGHVIARKLANRGHTVDVLLLSPLDKVGGDARTNLDLLPAYQVPVTVLSDENDVMECQAMLADAGVIVDALFGTGLQRDLGGRFALMVELINQAGPPVMAVDIPSGIDATTGAILGCAVQADLSVTFCRPKLGHFLHPGAGLRGDLEVVEIGIPDGEVERSEPVATLLDEDELAPLLEGRPEAAHKGTYGHLALFAGSEEMPGAAVLAANAAFAAGVGLVTLIVPDGVQPLLRSLHPEVIVRGVPARDGGFDQLPASRRDELLSGKTAIAIGPGVGRRPETVALIRALERDVELPMVIDADGLRALAGTGALASPAPRVMTPHPGEMAGLLNTATADVEGDRPGTIQRAARELNAIVVLKGAASLVSQPTGELFVNPTGNAGMACGGTGDVLTGLLGGLLAQERGLELDPLSATCCAVFLHGLAGDLAAEALGMAPMRATHITGLVPAALEAAAASEIEEFLRWR